MPTGTMDEVADDGPIRDAQSARPKPNPAIRSLICLVFLVNLAMSLYQLPLNQVIENRLCREHYAKAAKDLDEAQCKIDAVQKPLGWIQGTMETIWIAGDFVMTIPLTFLAERWGPRKVLRLNIASRIFMLLWAVIVGHFNDDVPTQIIIGGPMLSFLGGDCVFNSITYALTSASTNDPITRATYFGYLSSISYAVALIGPAMASLTMTVNLWLPFCIGIGLLVSAVFVISKLPQPSHVVTRRSSYAEDQAEPLLSAPRTQTAGPGKSLLRSSIQRLSTLHGVVVNGSWNLLFLLVVFFLASLASSDTKLLVLYISKRYGWTFASAGYLLSGKAVLNFTLLTLIIPWLLRSKSSPDDGHGHRQRSGDDTNIRYAKLCVAVSVLGALFIAFSAVIWQLVPSLLIYALGSALPVFTFSLLKTPAISGGPASRVNHATIGTNEGSEDFLFPIVMLVKTLGSLLGAPLMAFLWVRGIDIGGSAIGMPYFISACCYCVAFWFLYSIRIGEN